MAELTPLQFDKNLSALKALDALCFLEPTSPEKIRVLGTLVSASTPDGHGHLRIFFMYHHVHIEDVDTLATCADDDHDHEMALDSLPSFAPANTNVSCVHVQVDWVLHPVYLVICPYCTLCDWNTGSPLCVHDALSVLAALGRASVDRNGGANSSGASIQEPKVDQEPEPCSWSQEEHPLTGSLCWCLHVCELPAKLMLIQHGSGSKSGSESLNQSEAKSMCRYLLISLQLMAPAIGMKMSSSSFKRALTDLESTYFAVRV